MQGRVPGQWFPPPFTAPMDMKWMAPGVPVALSYNLKASFGYIGAEHMGVFGSELAVEAHKIILYSGSVTGTGGLAEYSFVVSFFLVQSLEQMVKGLLRGFF